MRGELFTGSNNGEGGAMREEAEGWEGEPVELWDRVVSSLGSEEEIMCALAEWGKGRNLTQEVIRNHDEEFAEGLRNWLRSNGLWADPDLYKALCAAFPARAGEIMLAVQRNQLNLPSVAEVVGLIRRDGEERRIYVRTPGVRPPYVMVHTKEWSAKTDYGLWKDILSSLGDPARIIEALTEWGAPHGLSDGVNTNQSKDGFGFALWEWLKEKGLAGDKGFYEALCAAFPARAGDILLAASKNNVVIDTEELK